jgi:hypothetical protein
MKTIARRTIETGPRGKWANGRQAILHVLFVGSFHRCKWRGRHPAIVPIIFVGDATNGVFKALGEVLGVLSIVPTRRDHVLEWRESIVTMAEHTSVESERVFRLHVTLMILERGRRGVGIRGGTPCIQVTTHVLERQGSIWGTSWPKTTASMTLHKTLGHEELCDPLSPYLDVLLGLLCVSKPKREINLHVL